MRSSTFGTQLRRGLFKRCPNCGSGNLFQGFFKLKPSCPSCAYHFEREEGYWTGAMIVNIAACEVWFFLLFVGILITTAPDIEWRPVLAVALITNGLLPVVFYPHSKTIWMAMDLHFSPNRSPAP
ncbi:MAG: DUF983 domain-containing protein [Actinobacteria bacterium]|nr:DUF983 domain-containing protein [Actinomycetota bacterium]